MDCYTCKEKINRPPSLLTGEKNFCNHACYSKFKAKKWSNENNPRWRGGDNQFKCKICSKECKRKKYGEDRKSIYCSIECVAKDKDKFLRGNKHWNWKGGTDTRYLKKTAPRPRPELCEICGNKGKGRNGIVLDHNHKTGKFRGWLCSNCNTALGLTKESIETLKALIRYIQDNEKSSLIDSNAETPTRGKPKGSLRD